MTAGILLGTGAIDAGSTRTVYQQSPLSAPGQVASVKGADDDALVAHCGAVAERIPVVGFYLQPSVGGRRLSHAFWRRFAGIPGVIGIKIAPFNRYQTLDVVRAVAEAVDVPVAAYQVSGEYAMVEAAAAQGWIDRERIILEQLTAIRRAGAGMVLTYWAAEAAGWLR